MKPPYTSRQGQFLAVHKPLHQLRRHACEVYHHYCQQAEPETTFEENLELMFNYFAFSPAVSLAGGARLICLLPRREINMAVCN